MEIFNATNLGFIMMGFGKTIEISALAIVFSILVGSVLAMAKQYCTGKLKFVSVIVSAYIELFGFFAGMRLVILPQTFRTIVPALFSQCTTVIKDSSYLAGINVAEFMYCTKVIMATTSNLGQVLLLYGFVFLLYFALNFGISLLVRIYQRRIAAA